MYIDFCQRKAIEMAKQCYRNYVYAKNYEVIHQ